MRDARSSAGPGGLSRRVGWIAVIGSAVAAGGAWARAGDTKSAEAESVARGYEIFNREWLPDDPRSHGGDGLGPVYNDTSCVACHNAGGSGGAGPVSKNIDILSASRSVVQIVSAGGGEARFSSSLEIPAALRSSAATKDQSSVPPAGAKPATDATLADRHAGFRTSRNVVLHKFGTDPNYNRWRTEAFVATVSSPVGQVSAINVEKLTRLVRRSSGNTDDAGETRGAASDAESPSARVQARIRDVQAEVLSSQPSMRQGVGAVGGFVVVKSQRNPTPLFGLGLIDAIPDSAIEAMERHEAMSTPETRGRASRLKDGRIGRLGWKGTTANTEDFVLNACAMELGLEVPGHRQAVVPQAPKYKPPGLDLNAQECASLVDYVRSLPRPVERHSTAAAEKTLIGAGKAAFAAIGCANCHAAKIGNVEGIYSDLLLHDMGSDLGDDGSYDPDDPSDPDDPPIPDDGAVAVRKQAETPVQAVAARTRRGAGQREWRTPPLWGFRDSGPYLHDGRAQTLEQAVAFHGGQGAASAQKFFELSPRERLPVEAFLKSLVAPAPVQLARRGE